jgi:hypothetical protein
MAMGRRLPAPVSHHDHHRDGARLVLERAESVSQSPKVRLVERAGVVGYQTSEPGFVESRQPPSSVDRMETRVNERCRISDVVEPCCFDQNIAVQVVEMPSKALCFRRHGSNVTQTYRVDRSHYSDTLDKMHDVAGFIEARTTELRNLVDIARKEGATWEDVGRELGVSKQAAQKRFGR